MIFAHPGDDLFLSFQEGIDHVGVRVVIFLRSGGENGGGDEAFTVGDQVLAGGHAVVGRRARQQRTVHAAAFQGGKGAGDVHGHKVHVVHGHARGGQIGRQQLMQVGALGAGDGFALQIFRRRNGFVGGKEHEGRGGTAVHGKHLDVRAVGGRQNHGSAAHGVENLDVAGGQGGGLIRAGGDFGVIHGHAQGVFQPGAVLFHNGGGVQGRGDVGNGDAVLGKGHGGKAQAHGQRQRENFPKVFHGVSPSISLKICRFISISCGASTSRGQD